MGEEKGVVFFLFFCLCFCNYVFNVPIASWHVMLLILFCCVCVLFCVCVCVEGQA